MGSVLRRVVLVGAVCALWLAVGRPVQACPFCTMQGQTLLKEVDQASMVLFGTLGNADEKAGTTDITVELVVKDNPFRAKRTKLPLKRYIPPAPDGTQYKYLVFCDIFKGEIDPYRGVAVKPDSKLAAYLRGAEQVKDKPIGPRLRYFFDYLDNSDLEISNDAYKEFGNADYNDYKEMAKSLPAGRIVKWLRDPNTPTFRYGLYASMLGHCGTEKDADVLKALLEDPDKRVASGVDGILAGYVMLKPKEGWKYVQDVLKDTKKDFMFRYAALRAVRFLHEYRNDIVSKKELVDSVCLLLSQEDIADLAVEDLRRWQAWDKADKVLALQKTDLFKVPIVRRSVLRYCLQCKGVPAAQAYVNERRKEDSEAVKEAEELLKLEMDTPASPPKKDGK